MLRDGNRMCLCGALALDLMSLPETVRAEVRAFFAENEDWLAEALAEGREAGVMHFEGTPRSQAEAFLSGVEGAMLLARAHQDVTRYCAVAHQHLAQLGLGGRGGCGRPRLSVL